MSKKFKKLAVLGLAVLTTQGVSADENTASEGVDVSSEVLLAGGCGGGKCDGGRKAFNKSSEIADNDYRPSYQGQPANQSVAPQPYTTYGCSADRNPQEKRYYSNESEMPSQGSNGCSGSSRPGVAQPKFGSRARPYNSPYADASQPISRPAPIQSDSLIQHDNQPQPTSTPNGSYGNYGRNPKTQQ